MRIPFVGPSNTARSYNAAVERAVNCYLEKNDDPDRPWVLYGTPGMTLRATLGTSPVRGCIRMGTLTYWVAGDTVYKMDSAYTATSLGIIGTSTGRVGMAHNGTEVLIVDGAKGWLATSTTLTEVVDVDFPDGVTFAVYLDNYFLVLGDGTQKLYWCETPGSGSAWNGLDFGSSEGNPDALIGAVVDHREIWLFGSESVEVWVNTGDAAAPFQRSGNTLVEQGAASGWSCQSIDNSVFWLGANKDGDGIVFRSQGYTPVRISTHALETAMRGYSTISDAFGYALQLDGHVFYALTFPTADATWLYDASTQQWTEWLWYESGPNEFHRHRANCHVFANRKHLVGDWETGEVYSLEPDVYKDAGDTIKRIRRTQTLRKGGSRLFFGDLNVEIETGVANADEASPEIMLRYSNDDGHSWSNEKTKSIGATGEYGKRVKFGPTGATKSGKGRVWELSITDPVKFALFGADVEVDG
jgi:hypothetical protein